MVSVMGGATRHPGGACGAFSSCTCSTHTRNEEIQTTRHHAPPGDLAMSRTVTVRTCPDCGAKILRGDDADVCGIPTTVDHRPVDNLGEFLALATGRRTYTLRPTKTRGSHGRELDERNATAIKTGARYPVHAEHVCGQPLPAAAESAETDRPQPASPVLIEGVPF